MCVEFCVVGKADGPAGVIMDNIRAFVYALEKGLPPREDDHKFSCRWCSKKFDTKQQRNNHIKRDHPGAWKPKGKR